MLKFFKKQPPKEGEERERLKKELFKFQKVNMRQFTPTVYKDRTCVNNLAQS